MKSEQASARKRKTHREVQLLLSNPQQGITVWSRKGLTPIGDDYTPSSSATIKSGKVLRVRDPFSAAGTDQSWAVKFLETPSEERLHRALASDEKARHFVVPLALPQRNIVWGRIAPSTEWRPVKVTRFIQSAKRSRISERERAAKKASAVATIQSALQELSSVIPIDLNDNDWSTSNNTIVSTNADGTLRILFHDFGCSALPKDSVCAHNK